MFRTMVTVRADEAAARRLTPRIQAYWVSTLVARKMSWLGTCSLSDTSEDRGVERPSGELAARRRRVRAMEGAKGRNKGSERIWE